MKNSMTLLNIWQNGSAQKNNQLKLSSMTDFARSKRRLVSMESQYSIDKMLNPDTFTKSKSGEETT